ncbi:MAG: DUF373 family protein [Methanoculleaceae archaeon]
MPPDRILILSVDRDDDLGYKAGIRTPVIGRASCLDAANRLALADPEDSDVNAIFQAIKTYDSFQQMGRDVEIALLAGDHLSMLEGDRRIAGDLEKLIHQTGVTSCVLVTDGAEDEFILPVIQSRIPISSIQRVVISQMPDLEGTYYIIKKLLDDPKIAKVVFVPIGLAMLLYATAFLLGYPEIATIIVVGVLGIYLLFKGFGIDEIFYYVLQSLKLSLQRGRFTFVSYLVAIVMIIVGVIMGLTSILIYYTSAGILQNLVTFIYGAVGWFVGAGLIASGGKIIDVFINEREELRRVLALPFYIGSLGLILYGASIYTLSISEIPTFGISEESGIRYLIFSIIGGLALSFTGVYLQTIISRWLSTERVEEPRIAEL